MSRTQVTGFTLDSKTTRDIDDVIHVERTESGWRVLVSISDVARAVPLGTPEDEQAKNLVATRYYGAGSSPMLPRPLSEQTLSLWSDRPRKTVSIDIRLSPSLETTDVSIFKSRFVPEFPRLVYDEIPSILGNKEHPCHDAVGTAVLLGLDLLEKRRAAGALALYDLNHGWVTTEEGYLKRIDRDESTVGYILVQEMMILANAEIAKFCVQKDIPILFRNHTARAAAPPREELLRRIEEASHIPDAQIEMVRQQTHLLLDRAAYAPTLRGHYGLNLPAYTHWTSPIRRYPDLVNHRQLNAFLKGEPLPYTLGQLQELAGHLNEVLEVQRVARETHLKDKADTLARKRADDPRRLDSLDAKGIERVVKVEARSGEDVGDVLHEAIVRRLHEGRLPGICAAVIFVEAPRKDRWMDLRGEIAKWVIDRPENAVTLLHLASQNGWPGPTYHVDQIGGPDHAPVFSGSAVIAGVPSATAPVTWSTQAVLASSRKEAMQRAAVMLVCSIAEIDPPVYEVKSLVPASKPKAPPKQDRDPISLLQEKSQAERLPAPQYAFEMTGPSHAPVVTCVVEFNGRTATGRASSKQDAKRAAARTLVGQFESV